MNIELLPKKRKDRMKDKMYIDKNNEYVIWSGKLKHCIHNKRKNDCVDCNGSSICEHNKVKRFCKVCSTSLCEHKKIKYFCKECSNLTCSHDKLKTNCKECSNSKCEHGKLKFACKECSACPHGKLKFSCKECNPCPHGKLQKNCRDCDGSIFCEHNINIYTCKICKPYNYLSKLMRARLYVSLKNYSNKKEKQTIEYLGCDIKTFREYFENLFTEGMCWEKMGEIHIDHRKPCCSFDLSKEEEIKKCFHYTNLQPLWATDNLSKSAKFDENTFLYKWCDIKNKWIQKICEEIC